MHTDRTPLSAAARPDKSSKKATSKHKKKINRHLLLAILLLVLLVYIFGLHQGLKAARSIETDASDRMWSSFLGFLDSDDGENDDDENASEEEDDDGIKDESETARKGDVKGEGDIARAANPFKELSQFETRVGHYQARMRRFKEQRGEAKEGPKAVEVLHEAPKTLTLPKPIINVGFPKAGTSTIFSFFHCNGLSSQHWFCCDDTKQKHPAWSTKRKLMSRCMLDNLINGTKLFEGCGKFDVYTEINGPRYFRHTEGMNMLDDGTILDKKRSLDTNFRLFFPQHHQIDRIHQDYPNATFILNHRPVDAWVASVTKWNKNLKFEILNEFFYRDQTRFLFGNNFTETDFTSPFFNANIKGLLKMVYEYHTNFIRDWVAQHPSHTLVEVDITHNETGQILADAFGLQEDCWGHFNMNKPKDHREEKKEGLIKGIKHISKRNREIGNQRLAKMRMRHQQIREELARRTDQN